MKNFGSMPGDAEGLFEFSRKLCEGMSDFWRLLHQRADHLFSHLRLAFDQLHGGQHQGERIVNVMSHVGQLPIELVELIDV